MNKIYLIILFVVFMIGNVMAGYIDFSYPENVEVGKEFEVTLKLIDFSDDLYAVKIEILNGSSTPNIAQRYWMDEWKSTFNWMYGAIDTSENNTRVFRLNITKNYEGLNNITVKVRKNSSSGTPLNETSYQININKKEDSGSGNDDNSDPNIYYELEWDEDDIINNKNFKIEVRVFNLENREYDFRLWIEDDDKIISERYDKGDDSWRSGRYYIDDFFEGPGNVTEKIKLRMNEDNQKFIGEVDLIFKLRDKTQIEERIDILKNIEKNNEIIIEDDEEAIKYKNSIVTSDVIRLGKTYVEESEDIKSQDNIVYESKTEIIKKYSVYVFALFSVIICVLIIWRKLE